MGTITPPLPQIIPIYRDGKLFMKGPDGKEYIPGSLGLLRSGLLSKNPPKPPEIPLKARINEQKDLLIKNTTLFLTIQYLWEKSYGNSFNYPIYTQMLSEAKNKATEDLEKSDQRGLSQKEKDDKFLETVEKQLKSVFFNKIKEMNADRFALLEASQIDASFGFKLLIKAKVYCLKTLDFFKACKARVIYSIFNRIIQPCVEVFINTHINMLGDYKDKISKDGFSAFKNELITNLNRCLTVLNGAYTTITKKEAVTGTISEMVAAELNKKAANQGRTSEELYREFATTLIVSTLGKYKGQAASWALQKFIKPGTIVESLVQTIAGSTKDNKGYSHAINSLVLAQLKEVEKLLEKQSTNPAPSHTAKPVSEERKRQLAIIIHQLLEILNKSECTSVDELTHVVNGTGFPLSIQRRHAETYGMSLLMNNIVLMISELIESNVNENQLDLLTLQLMKLTNDSFMPIKVVKEAEMKEVEKQVEATTKRILSLGIDQGINSGLSNSEGLFGAFGIPRPTVLMKKAGLAPLRWIANQVPLVHSIATQKVLGLFKLATERNAYLCALSHLIMTPHIEAMKKPN